MAFEQRPPRGNPTKPWADHSSSPRAARQMGIELADEASHGRRMGTKFFYALILTACGAVFNLLLYFTGFQTEKIAIGQHLQWIGFIIMIVILWLGIKAVREESPNKALSYGAGVGAGTLISLYSGLMSAVYTYIHFKFINVDFVDYQLTLIRAKWAEHGMSEAQMEQAEGFTRKLMAPAVQAVIFPFAAVFIGLVISLILAAFLKRNPPDEVAPAA
jgi:ABC-type sugar transport system permease subunit